MVSESIPSNRVCESVSQVYDAILARNVPRSEAFYSLFLSPPLLFLIYLHRRRTKQKKHSSVSVRSEASVLYVWHPRKKNQILDQMNFKAAQRGDATKMFFLPPLILPTSTQRWQLEVLMKQHMLQVHKRKILGSLVLFVVPDTAESRAISRNRKNKM